MNKNTKKNDINTANSSTFSVPTLFHLQSIQGKRIDLSFTAENVSVDGGLLLLKEVEKQIGLIKGIASCIKDNRHQGYVQHSIETLLSQRVFQIAVPMHRERCQ